MKKNFLLAVFICSSIVLYARNNNASNTCIFFNENQTTISSNCFADFQITATTVNHGIISPSGVSIVGEGGSITYTISAAPGYAVSDVKVDGVSIGIVSTYTFTNVISNHTIAISSVCHTPPIPGVITATQYKNVCDKVITCSIEPVVLATSYLWTAPDGSTIISGQGTTSIELYAPVEFKSGRALVNAINSCGISNTRQSYTIFSLPSKAIVSGPSCVAPKQSGLVYTVTNPEPNVTYTWSASGPVIFTAGQGTPVVTLTWKSTDGQLKCTASNRCAEIVRVAYPITVGCSAVANASKNNNVTIFPNPVSSSTTISFNSSSASAYTLKITDAAGKLINTKSGIAAVGTNNIFVNMNDYVSGIYFATITTTAGTSIIKIMKD